MKIGGKKLDESEVFIIASPPQFANITSDDIFTLVPCQGCDRTLYIDLDILSLIQRGVMVACLSCAVRCHPNVIAGCDPDTRRELTLVEFLRRPNTVGGYRYEDVEEDDA